MAASDQQFTLDLKEVLATRAENPPSLVAAPPTAQQRDAALQPMTAGELAGPFASDADIAFAGARLAQPSHPFQANEFGQFVPTAPAPLPFDLAPPAPNNMFDSVMLTPGGTPLGPVAPMRPTSEEMAAAFATPTIPPQPGMVPVAVAPNAVQQTTPEQRAAQIAQQEQLAAYQQFMGSLPSPTWGEYLRSVAKTVPRGVAETTADSMMGVATLEKVIDAAINKVVRTPTSDKPARDLLLGKASTALKEWANKTFKSDPRAAEDFVHQIGQGLGSTLPFLATGLVGQAAKAPGAVTALTGAAAGAGQGYEDAKKHGADETAALKSAGLNAIGGATEALPIEHLFKRLNEATGGKLKRTIATMIAQGGEEGSQEAIQQVIQNAAAQNLYDKDREIFDGVKDNFDVGAAVGAIFGLGGGAVSRGAKPEVKKITPIESADSSAGGGGKGVAGLPAVSEIPGVTEQQQAALDEMRQATSGPQAPVQGVDSVGSAVAGGRPSAEGVPTASSRGASLAKAPDHVREDIERRFATAEKLGLVEQIEKLSADRLTGAEIVDRLHIQGEDSLDRAGLVRAVKAKRGIPSMDDAAEFEAWRNRWQEEEAAKHAAEDADDVTSEPQSAPPPAVAAPTPKEQPDVRTVEAPEGQGTQAPKEVLAPATKQPPTGAVNATATKTPAAAVESAHTRLSRRIADYLGQGMSITAGQLKDLADVEHDGTMAEGKYSPKDAYDAMESGVNQFIRSKPQEFGAGEDATVEKARERVRSLEALQDKLPTQTRRTAETDEFQQFSTPPAYAYVASWAANIRPGDSVIEPSAGTGNLLVHAQNAGAKEVMSNELAPRRAELVRALKPSREFTENAEQLHNILPADVKPSVVVMNPPFSATAGRMGTKKVTETGAVHIEQALKRLQPGGRLVAIVGRGMAFDRPSFKDWWGGIRREYNVRANIGVPGSVYRKFGTTFDTRLLVIDKSGPTQGEPVSADAATLDDAIGLLETVRNERQPSQQPVQTPAVQPDTTGEGVRASAQGTEGADRSGVAADVSTPVVGVRQGGRREGELVGAPATDGGEAAVSPQPATGGDVVPEAGRGRARRTRREQPAEPKPTGGVEPAGGAASEPDVSRSGGVPAGERPSVAGELEWEVRAPAYQPNPKDPAQAPPPGNHAIFETYAPPQAIKGSKPHPTELVESAAMSSVSAPPIQYKPKLSQDLIDSAKLSDAQLEPIARAGQAHSELLPDGRRRGSFIGDGTGVGKGREISGIIMDNFNRGRTKAVWMSEKWSLMKDAIRDWTALGGKEEDIHAHKDQGTKKATAKLGDRGILFSTYDLTKSDRKGKDGKTRMEQIVEWFGKDYDGVVIFDESHNMANAVTEKGGRGMKKASQKALAGVELQKLLPNARVVYASATGATEVSNLAYADRLGLWGKDRPFADARDFSAQVAEGGVTAMEVIARDLKSLGLYTARSLSFRGVNYEPLTHELTPDQRAIYDELAGAWQIVLENLDAALGDSGGDSKARAAALSQFWSAHQRFFNQIITSMQMPSVVRSLEKDLADGRSPVLQLVSTGEAQQERKLAEIDDEEDLENLDMTPREGLMQYLQNAFPVNQYENYLDENGEEKTRIAVDSKGNPVQNADALARRESLMDKLGSIRVPESALDQLVNHFGPDQVAEVTGRSRRVVRDKKTSKVSIEQRGEKAAVGDAAAFVADKKPIIVFSEKGGTGASYHADAGYANQRPRVHYILQAGWRADKAIQGLGRSHRSNQTSTPVFRLVSTDLPGHKRFISTIARRLDQLGALTKGERRTGGQGMFSQLDNLESSHATDALRRFLDDIMANKVKGITMGEFEAQTGIRLLNKDGSTRQEPVKIQTFLNRLLSLNVDMQGRVFEEYISRLKDVIEQRRAAGTLDVGVETKRADSIEKVSEQTIHKDKETGALTKHVRVRMKHKNNPTGFDVMKADPAFQYFARNSQSGRTYAFIDTSKETDIYTGKVYDRFRQYSPLDYHLVRKQNIESPGGHWQKLTDEAAKTAWESELGRVPEFESNDVDLVTGQVINVWDRLPAGHKRVFRMETNEGEKLLGMVVPPEQVVDVLTRLGAKPPTEDVSPEAVLAALEDGGTAQLANGWSLKRSLVSGEGRIELVGPDYTRSYELDRIGVFRERINFNTRFFIPAGEKALEVLKAVTASRPVTSVRKAVGGARRRALDAGPDGFLADPAGVLRDPDIEGIHRAAGLKRIRYGGIDLPGLPFLGYGTIDDLIGRARRWWDERARENSLYNNIRRIQRGMLNLKKLHVEDMKKLYETLDADPNSELAYKMHRAMTGDLGLTEIPAEAQAWVAQARALQDDVSANALLPELAKSIGEDAPLSKSVRERIGRYIHEFIVPKRGIRERIRQMRRGRFSLAKEQFKFRRDRWHIKIGKHAIAFNSEAEARTAYEEILWGEKNAVITRAAKDRGVNPEDLKKAAARRVPKLIRPLTEAKRLEMGFNRNPMLGWGISYLKTAWNASLLRMFRQLDGEFAEKPPADVEGEEALAQWAKGRGLMKVEGTPERVGVLSGKYLPRRFAKDINNMVRTPEAFERMLRKYIEIWKASKTIYSPATHFRNILGNVPMSDLAGVAAFNPLNTRYYMAAIRSIREKDVAYRKLLRWGVLGGEFVGNILNHVNEMMQEGDDAHGAIVTALKKVGANAGAFYNGVDQMFKLAAFHKYVAKGMKPRAAAREVNKWFPNYAELWRPTQFLSRWPFGGPFLAFNEQAVRIAGRAAVKHPLKLAKWLAFPGVMTALSAYMIGLPGGDDDDERKLIDSGRSYFEPLLPFRGARGEALTLDMRYMFPMANEVGALVDGDGVQLPFFLATPPVSTAIDVLWNKDPYFGREIWKKEDSMATKVGKGVWHIVQDAAPIPSLGTWGIARIRRAFGDESRETAAQAIAGAVVGISVRQPYVGRKQAFEAIKALAEKDPDVAAVMDGLLDGSIERMSYKELTQSLGANERFQSMLDLYNSVYRAARAKSVTERGVLQGLRNQARKTINEANNEE